LCCGPDTRYKYKAAEEQAVEDGFHKGKLRKRCQAISGIGLGGLWS
jgi:hypothetical protein